jgi:hypothetical protein
MTDGVYEISTKQRVDVEPDYKAIMAEMQALVDLADSFTK